MNENRGPRDPRLLLRDAESAMRGDDLDALTRVARELVEVKLDASSVEKGPQTSERMRLRLEQGGRIKAAREMSDFIAGWWPGTPEGETARAEGSKRELAARQRKRDRETQRATHEREERERKLRQRQERGERDLASQRAKAEAEVSAVEDPQQARDLADAHRKRGQYGFALLFAEQAFALTPDGPSITRLAACQRDVFRYDEALATYRDAWQFEEHRVIVRTGAAAVLADLGRLDDAWTTIEPAVRHEDDPFALNCAGRIRRLMGDLAQAAEYHERALAQNKGRRQAKRELEKLVKQARGDGDEELATRVMKALALSE